MNFHTISILRPERSSLTVVFRNTNKINESINFLYKGNCFLDENEENNTKVEQNDCQKYTLNLHSLFQTCQLKEIL